jgi:hypothetical protein
VPVNGWFTKSDLWNCEDEDDGADVEEKERLANAM